jgi:hypothetical protein
MLQLKKSIMILELKKQTYLYRTNECIGFLEMLYKQKILAI